MADLGSFLNGFSLLEVSSCSNRSVLYASHCVNCAYLPISESGSARQPVHGAVQRKAPGADVSDPCAA